MLYFMASKNGVHFRFRQAPLGRSSMLYFRLLIVAMCWLHGAIVHAQSRVLPSHGKIKLDSYNYLLRDTHPASQAQTNYLQNRRYLTGLKKAERLERQERLDVYGERQFIKTLQNYDRDVSRIAAGSSTSARSLTSFWVLVSAYGDRAEVYEALSRDVPPMPHDEFTPTSLFILAVQPNGELVPPPLMLEGAAGADASKFQAAWRALVKNMRATGRLSAPDVAHFRNCVADYRQHGADAIQQKTPASGRYQAGRYLVSLGTLADALYRPLQCAQIQRYVEQGGYAFYGYNMLGLIQHMLQNRVTPAQGSASQLALAEVARPIGRVLQQEVALHIERIDSLAAGQGHRFYAAEYRPRELPVRAVPGTQVSQLPGSSRE